MPLLFCCPARANCQPPSAGAQIRCAKQQSSSNRNTTNQSFPDKHQQGTGPTSRVRAPKHKLTAMTPARAAPASHDRTSMHPAPSAAPAFRGRSWTATPRTVCPRAPSSPQRQQALPGHHLRKARPLSRSCLERLRPQGPQMRSCSQLCCPPGVNSACLQMS